MTHEKLKVVQERLRQISSELNELNRRIFSGINLSQQGMKRVQALQTAGMECRKTLLIAESQSQEPLALEQQAAPSMAQPVGVQDCQEKEPEDTDRDTPTGPQSGMSILTGKPCASAGKRRSDEQGVIAANSTRELMS